MNFKLLDFDFIGVFVDAWLNGLATMLSADGVAGKAGLIFMLVMLLGGIACWAKANFASDDEPFRFIEQR